MKMAAAGATKIDVDAKVREAMLTTVYAEIELAEDLEATCSQKFQRCHVTSWYAVLYTPMQGSAVELGDGR